MSSDQKHIVVLGGAWGGVSVAQYVLRHAVPKLPSPSSYKVILVSPSKTFYCRTASPRALISDDLLDQSKLFTPIAPGFEQYPKENFQFVHGKATAWDTNGRTVQVQLAGSDKTESFTYHALVVATGSSTTSPLMGAQNGEKVLKESWAAFRAALPTAKHIVIGGGGATGVETAAELGENLNGKPGWFSGKNTNPKVKITIVNSRAHLLPLLRSSIADKAEPLLAKLGVTVVNNRRVTSVTPEDAGRDASVAAKTTVTLDNGEKLEADLYIPAAGYAANTSFAPKQLLADDGRIKVDAQLRVPSAGDRVYAIGDCSTYARQAIHLLLEAIPVCGNNVKRDLFLAEGQKAGAPAEKTYKEDTRETQLVPIGKGTGIGAAMGYSMPGMVISLIKGRDYWLSTIPALVNGKQWAKEAA